MNQKEYVCICGRKFNNPQAFNGHKSHCKAHQLNKYGNLDKLTKNYALKNKKISNTLLVKNEELKKYKKEQWQNSNYKCERCGKVMTKIYGSGRFCSKSCANSRQHTSKTKDAISRGILTSEKWATSNKNKVKKNLKDSKDAYKLNPNHCEVCSKILDFANRRRSTCSEKCLHKLRAKNGRNIAAKSCKRSKNEICLFELCKEHFGKDNVLHNEPMFNGWDADIIIPKYKMAILWNGPWHYRQVTKKHSLKQVQNRDKIKLKEIKRYGYTPYVIKDSDGKYDINKVEKEFEKLLKTLNLFVFTKKNGKSSA